MRIPLPKFLYGKNFEFNHTSQQKKVGFITGADLMIRKELFNALNGFDNNIFMYCEDADLAYRVRMNGYEILNVPKAKIVHLEGKSILFQEKLKKIYYERRKIFFKNHYSKFYINIANIIELSFLKIACLYFSLKRDKERRNRFIKQSELFKNINF